MQTIGLIGGLAWPSTADYYRLLCSRTNVHFEKRGSEPPYPTPHLIIDSLNIDATRRLHGREGDEASWGNYEAVFRESFMRLKQAGATFGAIASNTPHTRLEGIRQGLDFRVVSILDATAEQAEALADEALVLGTPVTMRHQAYPRAAKTRRNRAAPAGGRNDRAAGPPDRRGVLRRIHRHRATADCADLPGQSARQGHGSGMSCLHRVTAGVPRVR